ncbi:hypothetical protein [Planomicrobium sp. MB-3u-38]|uniref:hypothetical protein n=1 Tax=Planomicrobium sp. MB-3u-38 TaxID=2058318 RepID=UPI000C7DF03E|nr:hypothetical protein [Planomicrobium sp. MB-3u-38]PKH10654.1 hypothetical protein CXF70_08565 [Planomicrobium sp. MB-3u-38]
MATGKEPTSVTSEQVEAMSDFLQYLFEDDVNLYWSSISKIDQARVYGMYIGQVNTGVFKDSYGFYDFVKEEFMIPQREVYENVKENAGFAQFIRYSDEGEPQIFMQANVSETKIYNEPTQVEVVPITLALDTDIKKDEIKSVWKVRMYSDKLYQSL